MNTARPHDNTYWVEPGRVLAGEYPGAPYESPAREKLRAYLAAGITFFLDLTEEHEPLAPYTSLLREEAARYGMDVRYRRMPIRDMSIPRSRAEMQAILDAIDQALGEEHRVYIHCWGGIGRTGTVVGCYLVRGGLAGPEALATLARWWRAVEKSKWHPRSPQTDAQEAYVLAWREET